MIAWSNSWEIYSKKNLLNHNLFDCLITNLKPLASYSFYALNREKIVRNRFSVPLNLFLPKYEAPSH